MFLLRSNNGPRTTTLNAIPPTDPKTDDAPGTDDERKARHLRMLRELAELAMELATLAAKHARAKAAEPAPAKRPAGTTDPAVLFTRLSRSVQQSIALEARLAAGDTTAGRQARGRTVRSDPRRSPLRNMVLIFTKKHPDQNALQRESNEQIDTELNADPEQKVALCDILETVCEDLDIKIDYNLLPNDLLRLALPPGFDPDTSSIDHLLPDDWQPVDHLRLKATGPPA